MAKTPFHRRVLPWLFTIIFFIMAPALVFYTAGYRWNPKKHVIERNGTLIIDTQPSGASISLNGKVLPQATPVTLQDMSPGNYEIKLDLAGYHPWTKTLSIEPERVTFATEIILWPQGDPQQVGNESFARLISDPDSGQLLAVAQPDGQGTSFSLLDEKTGQKTKTLVSTDKIKVLTADWNPHDDRQILIFGQTSSTDGYWLLQFSNLTATRLPEGDYHWETNGLIGYAEGYRLTVRSDLSVSRTVSAPDIRDSLDSWELKQPATGDSLILLDDPNAKEGLIMPQGQWRFWSLERNALIFHAGDHWLWMEAKKSPAYSHQAQGDGLLPLTVKRQMQYAFKNQNEAWVWLTDQDPELIYRQSDPLVSVAWQPDGMDLMVATKTEVTMFSLDDRNGREMTPLASFDEIQDATIIGDDLFVSGRRGQQAGLWSLKLTSKTSAFLPLGSLF